MAFSVVILLIFLAIGLAQLEKPYKQVGNDLKIIGAGDFNVTTKQRRLIIQVHRFNNPFEFFYICIGPVAGAHPGCPSGYQSFDFFGDGIHPNITSEYDFNGIFKYHGENLYVHKLIGDVVMLHIEKAPTGMSVKLLNASIYEDTKIPITPKTKTASTITIIVLGICCLFSVLFVVATILQHCRSKKGSVDLSEIV